MITKHQIRVANFNNMLLDTGVTNINMTMHDVIAKRSNVQMLSHAW